MSIASEWRKHPTNPRTYDARPDVGFGEAIKRVAEAVRGKRVTFRVGTFVSEAPSRGYRKTLDDLPPADVDAGVRGTTITVMSDGRTLVELDDGRPVLAMIGSDCRLLTRWHRIVDWWQGRQYV